MAWRGLLLPVTIVLLFSLIVVGAYVAADPLAGEACGSSASWPLCNGQILPSADPHVIAEYTHRLLAVLSATFLFLTAAFLGVYKIGRGADAQPSPARATLLAASLLMLFQIGLGDVVIGADLQPALVSLHQGTAMAIFGLVVLSHARVKYAR